MIKIIILLRLFKINKRHQKIYQFVLPPYICKETCMRPECISLSFKCWPSERIFVSMVKPLPARAPYFRCPLLFSSLLCEKKNALNFHVKHNSNSIFSFLHLKRECACCCRTKSKTSKILLSHIVLLHIICRLFLYGSL